MSLNWINVEEFSFHSLLLTERFQIRLFTTPADPEQRLCLGIALKYNPVVAWYLAHRCPERAADIERLVREAPDGVLPEEVRRCEVAVMAGIEDFIIYTRPELMATHCNFIYGWDKERLFELADFNGRIVLDVGSGSGRLAFAAAERAKMVYASEPVGTLREFLRDKIAREGIQNIRVVDGMAHSLAYPDDTFDIVMSGHVVGDDLDAELAEMTRVVRDGGWILDCPGEDDRKGLPDQELIDRGWEMLHYTSKFGGDVYRYRKQIFK